MAEEKDLIPDSSVSILIDLNRQTHSCVKAFQRDLSRNTAMTVANGVMINEVKKNCTPCRAQVKELELWRAGHEGEATGCERKKRWYETKTTLICTIIITLLTLFGGWFTYVRPILGMKNSMTTSLEKFEAIGEKYQAWENFLK